jgi:hypothetical protein
MLLLSHTLHHFVDVDHFEYFQILFLQFYPLELPFFTLPKTNKLLIIRCDSIQIVLESVDYTRLGLRLELGFL